MVSSTLDLLTGGSSFGISSIVKLFFQHGENLRKERATFYKHALDINTREMEDVQNARAYDSDGTRWTRRIISMVVVLFFITLAILAFLCAYGHVAPISMPVEITHQFLLFSWKTTKILKLYGFAYFPWMPQFFFMIGGFYFGIKVSSQ